MSKDTVRLVANDGLELSVSRENAMLNRTLAGMLEDLENVAVVPLPQVSGKILQKIAEFGRLHRHTEQPDPMSLELAEWQQQFMRVDQQTLLELLLAANYLENEALLELCSKTVALMIKGKSVEQIRETFNIKNDFTPEEEAQVRSIF
jgi:S-phase kinase-associated protein 1